ncbi:MAG TPA: ABC transporter substrate-binding protein [Candidatus Limnocylindria bacterium]|jgi:alpha-glucoside transport system substrate-binding protein
MPRNRFLAGIAVLSLLAAACQPSASQSPAAPGGPSEGAEPLGGSISILATWTDAEQESFLAMIQPWVDANGVEVEYEGNRDLSTILTTRVEGGDPPDVAGLPNPGAMAEFARNGDLIDLGDVIDVDAMLADYNEGYIADGTVDGTLVGIFIKIAVKGLIWYNPQAFADAGYEVPTDWDGFTDLVEQIRSDGATPWGVGLESGADSGWPGTDWIEDFVLRQSGPDIYDQWWQGELAWSSPEIRAAFEAFGAWAADADYVAGGPNNVLSVFFGNGGDCLFADPAGCYLHHQASFMSGFFETNFPDVAVAGDTYDFFGMPGESYTGVTQSGDLFGMFRDTPQARSLMQYLVTADAQQIWVERGGAISGNGAVALDAYPDDTSRRIADILTSAEVVRFDAGDKMPAQMGRAFFGAILDYIQNPANLDQVLSDLDAVQAEAYGN